MATVVQYTRIGPPEVLEVVEVPDPVAGPGEVVVAVRAAGVNPIETKVRSGRRPSPALTGPRRLGSDGAGVVVGLGDGVEGLRLGDEVVVTEATGTYATHVVVRPENLHPKPDAISFEQAAALGIPVGTAYQALASLGVVASMTLVVHGGAGAVGLAAVQLARARGARVVATAGERNHALLRSLGAEPVVYGPGLEQRLRDAAPDGVDRVLDAAGTDEAIAASLALVADPRHIGTLVVGARAAELGIRAWRGGSPDPLTPEETALRAEAIPAVLALAEAGRFSIEVGRRFPLAEAVEAHRESETGHARGKIVLLP